ncbi:aldose 1-epimerase [Winogradskyella sp.]|uniref:aldose 1-epimerase n=1 Tax=Winogradskyella sp. TaxID=1883156 RepID=UPI0025FB199B|nr:aldose 1-epimerase [Winogradskyella sp.]
MYTLTEIETEGLQYIELASSDSASKAKVCLNQGGRLSNLVFEDIQILAEYDASTYKDNYASSILFPFANRIKDGEYVFENSNYKLECNEVDKNNALHGLVYDKTFSVIDRVFTNDYASATLQYKGNGKNTGFPFKFNINLTYTLSKNGITLSITIANKGKKIFPFTLGWHPYFNSQDLDKSSVIFRSQSKYVFDNQQIITGETSLDVDMPYLLKDVKLDDGYPLETNEIDFSTPEYDFNIRSNSKENFLQLYTPDDRNIIAIEPMTGAADNFNNHIGLQTLSPNNTYNVKWNLAIETKNTKIETNKLINKLCKS